jgi:hypothetical protein
LPVNGRCSEWNQLHLWLSASAGTGSGSWQIKGELDSLYVQDITAVLTGIQLNVTLTNSGGTVEYQGPNQPSGGYSASGSRIDIYFQNWRMYGVNPGGTNYLTHVFWDSIQIWVNGTLSTTLGSGDQVSTALGPAWVPLFCGLVQMSGDCTTNVSGSVQGGWNYQPVISGPWVSPPIAFAPNVDAPLSGPGEQIGPGSYSAPVTVTAPFGLSSAGIVSGSTTASVTINVSQAAFISTGPTQTRQYGTVVIIPNLPKQIVRMNTDYGATFWSFASPEVETNSTRSISYLYNYGSPSLDYSITGTLQNTSAIFTRTAPGSQEVGASTSSLESYFGPPTYSMVQTRNYREQAMSTTLTEIEGINTLFPAAMDSIDGAESWSLGAYDMPPYMFHQDIRVNYFNSAVCHPHWSIGYFTGPWTYEAAPLYWSAADGSPYYWGPVREQYLSAQQRRNDIYSCPLESSGYTPFLDSYFQSNTGSGMRWIGVCRFYGQDVVPPSSLTLDSTSSASWIVDSGCTLSFGSGGITITPSATVCKFDLVLISTNYSYAEQPWLYPAIAQSVLLNWPTTNITQVVVYTVSEDGSTKVLLAQPSDTTTTPDVNYTLPRAQDAAYAGSWGLDNSYGGVTDSGVDVPSGGISSAVLNDAALTGEFGLLLGSQAVKLHFEVTVASTSSTAEIAYPVFYAATGYKQTILESGQVADLLWANGPGVRLGTQVWDYGSGFFDPPTVSGLGYKWSVVDWLAHKRVLLYGVGPTAALPGGGPNLTTEIAQIYDTYEGQSVDGTAMDSLAFVLPPKTPGEADVRAALVNTWSELPPLAGYPTFGRNTDWTLNTTPVQQVWTWAQLPRYIVSANARADLLNPSTLALQTSPSGLTIPGWQVTVYTTQINNSETDTWHIVTGYGTGSQKLWAYVTPWHGYFCELTLGHSSKPLAYDVSRMFRHARISQQGTSELYFGVSPNGNPYAWADIDAGFVGSNVRIRWKDNSNLPCGVLYSATDTSTTLSWVSTKNEGNAFGSPMTIASTLAAGGFFDYDETTDFNRWFYWEEGSSSPYTIYMCILDAQNNVIKPRTATNLTNSDLAPIAVRESPVTGGGRRIGLLYSTGGVMTFVTARDGVSFS